jgi:hypothetical protein
MIRNCLKFVRNKGEVSLKGRKVNNISEDGSVLERVLCTQCSSQDITLLDMLQVVH